MLTKKQIKNAERMLGIALKSQAPGGIDAVIFNANLSGMFAALHWALGECPNCQISQAVNINVMRIQSAVDQAEAEDRDSNPRSQS